jgi:hypothetical protein
MCLPQAAKLEQQVFGNSSGSRVASVDLIPEHFWTHSDALFDE